MTVTHYDLTATFLDPEWAPFTASDGSIVAWIETNVGSSEGIVDTVAQAIALGGLRKTVNSAGAVSWTNLVGSDSDPEDIGLASGTLQYRVTAEYRNPVTRRRDRWTSGWFSLTADVDLSEVIAEQYLPAAWVTQATAAIQAIIDDAEANFADLVGQGQALLDAQIALSGIDDTDSAVAALIGNPLLGPLTRAALSTSTDYRAVRTISPLDPTYGAAGDDTADDTAAIQAAFTAAASFGLAVDLRGKTYKTTNTLTVAAGSDISNGTIRCTGTGKKIVNVTGSNVKLRRLSVVGRHATADGADSETGIYAEGADASNTISGILIEQCSVELVGKNGIIVKHVDGFRILDCDLGDLGYAGIGTISSFNGVIDGCRIENVVSDNAVFGSTDAYGIHMSRVAEVTSLVTSPRSANITVTNNLINGVPTWEGIDTHGGERLTIADNMVLGCRTGIAIVPEDAEGNVSTYGAKQIIVKGNVIDSLVTDGSAGAGITFVGAAGATSADPATDYATGVIIGNVVKNHGPETSNANGAIHVRNTYGVSVIGNEIVSPGCHGIVLYYDNRGVSVIGNTVSDPWSTTQSVCGAIGVRGGNQTGSIVGNTLLDAGDHSGATNRNRYGVYCSSIPATVDIALGLNYFSVASVATVSDETTGVLPKFTAQIAAKVGSQTSPGYSFNGDTNTGLYWVGADSIGVTTGGSLRVRWNTTAMIFSDGYSITAGATNGLKIGTANTEKLGFWNATPIVRPSAYTQTYSTADKTLSAYTANAQSSAYTGSPADAASTAKLADLNALRVAYENLRAFVEDLAQHHNSVLDDLQAMGLLA